MVQTNLVAFMTRHGIATYDDLLRRAIDDVGWFWDAVLEDLGIEFYRPYTTVFDPTPGIEFPRWCVDGEMNIVAQLPGQVAGDGRARPGCPALGRRRRRTPRTLTYAELRAEVNRCANALRSLGLGKGDAVGLYMPMIPELAIAFLAIIKIGGIILPLFSGYGQRRLVTRLADADAKALITADGLLAPRADRGDETGCRRSRARGAQRRACDRRPPRRAARHALDARARPLVARTGARPVAAQAETERTTAEDVLMIIYTSGTTGKPKGRRPHALRLSRSRPPRTCATAWT